MKDHGYIALHRRVFNHPLFKHERPFTRVQAWLWLIARASWCPEQVRVGRSLVTLDRGQLASTTRDLGKAWGWHRSRVDRFLRTLAREAMIRTRAGETVTETAPETVGRRLVTVITICKYSEFQNPSTGQDSEPRQQPRRKPRRGEQQELDLSDEILPQESNQQTKKEEDVGEKRIGEKREKAGRNKPRHGQISKKHGTIWCDHGTDEYKIYADDFHQVTGVWPIPQPYIDGKGRWFKQLGEGHVPLSRVTAVAQAAIEQSHRERKRSA